MRGPETEKSHVDRLASGFYNTYMRGKGLDIGYKGANPIAEPVLDSAIGVDIDYPGYDGVILPFEDNSQDYVFTSHVLEHISDPVASIKEWFRVLKVGGHLILIVPHMYLYEKKLALPSRWNEDHKRFYTPEVILTELRKAIDSYSYRLVHMRDNDDDFNYSIPPEQHSSGCYEIECVIKKVAPPAWQLK